MNAEDSFLTSQLPNGQPIIRTVPQPSNLNINGNVFGGWILSQMDVAGGTLSRRVAGCPVATVAVEKMKFHQPVHVGDSISIFGSVERIGRTSITVRLEVFAEDADSQTARRVTEGRFIFVAIDDTGRPTPIKR